MSGDAKPTPVRLGFLTAVEVPEQGYVGGMLITNRQGRPLEFQCTTAVRPNRTQEILYGPTLGAFVLGDLIGRVLVEKASVKPHLILTERPEFLELRSHISLPVLLLTQEKSEPADSLLVRLGKQQMRLHDGYPADRAVVEREGEQVPRDADLREPFARIREALQETIRGSQLKSA